MGAKVFCFRRKMLEFRRIKTSRGTIHAVVGGEGEPLILVHGYGENNSWRTWERNVDALSMVARVYALDLPGYGESDGLEEARDSEGQANAIRELMEAEEIERTSMAGLSWGGEIVQNFAMRWPERVRKLVLVDSLFDSSEEGLARLGRILAPTLIVWDEDDALIPAQWAHILAMAIRDSKLVILAREQRDPDASPQNKHWAQMSHSAWFNKVVSEFLQEE
jgi:pimeloyl-ACP methyl ester carboxylesterase